ncbi:MAG: hypothetical protein ACT4P6_03735 [Gemmatimonadaceae bacterium]
MLQRVWTPKRSTRSLIGATAAITLTLGSASLACQDPALRTVGENALRAYSGAYQWGPNELVYLQLWSELTGSNQLVAFDESGEVRVLYPTDRDRFYAGPGAAVPKEVESTIERQRDAAGRSPR